MHILVLNESKNYSIIDKERATTYYDTNPS